MSEDSYTTVVLDGVFRTKAPLSHIGESIASDSYLVEEPIVQPDGTVVNVFAYSGNAFRGQLRDHAAAFFLDRLEMRAKLPAYHLLFSGGSIHGSQKVDIAFIRRLRSLCPPASLFGGGIGTALLPGKLAVGIAYPACAETQHILGLDQRQLPAYGELTTEKSYTRQNDAKADELVALYFEGDGGQIEENAAAPNQQMRFSNELLAAGVSLLHRVVLADCTPIEAGVFVAALRSFAQTPYLGGQRARGHGAVEFAYTRAGQPFIAGGQGAELQLSPEAQQYITAYEEWLQSVERADVAALLEAIK